MECVCVADSLLKVNFGKIVFQYPGWGFYILGFICIENWCPKLVNTKCSLGIENNNKHLLALKLVMMDLDDFVFCYFWTSLNNKIDTSFQICVTH